MAKLKSDPIEQSDLIEYLEGYSDFSFEIKVRKSLTEVGFTCEHGGTYSDPATDKPREFDIRAFRDMRGIQIRLAVECKNVRPNYPLLISCVPRSSGEAFIDAIYSKPQRQAGDMGPRENRFATVVKIPHHEMYRSREPVGKSITQVGRLDQRDQGITASGSDIYDKWAQALSSAHDLAQAAATAGWEHPTQVNHVYSIILPVVVIPDDRLWMTTYDEEGNRTTDPVKVKRCSYFVNRRYSAQAEERQLEFTVSHLELVTHSGAIELAKYLKGEDFLEEIRDRMPKHFT